MSSQRVYINATIYGARITGLRNLWEPSTEFQGKKVEKPNYITAVLVPKTAQFWYHEPVLAGFAASCSELYAKVLGPMNIPFEQVLWPVKDGDMPPAPGKAPIEWCKGHWFISGSSTSPINVDIVQSGQAVKLQNRAGVKAGDFVVLSGVVCQKTNDPRGVKLYANNVLFIAQGEEIAIGNSVSGSELMEQAKAKGMTITGFGAPHAGFSGQSFSAPQQGGFNGSPAFPSQVSQAPQGFQAPAPVQPPQGGFPGQAVSAQPQAFSPQGGAPTGFPGQPQQGGGFAPPPTGFAPPR